MRVFRWDKVTKGAMAFSLPLAFALWYTLQIGILGKAVGQEGGRFLSAHDPLGILGCWVYFTCLVTVVLRMVLDRQLTPAPEAGRKRFFPAFLVMALWQLPFLLAFYPAPGMNDTAFMMDNPLWAIVQFPWFYSLIYGYGTELGRYLFGTGEPVIFTLALLQLLVYTFGLTWIAFWVKEKFGKKPGFLLWAYFTFFPMIGNYGIAAVRDGIFSLSLVVCMVLLMDEKDWTNKKYGCLALSFLGMALFRSNGLMIALAAALALGCRWRNWKKPLMVFLLCALISMVPGRAILSYHDWEPQFQESMDIPIQQLGRVLVMDGYRSDETKELMNELLPDEKWKNSYYAETVDFVKWHDDFRRNVLNREKKKFLACWLDTGLHNPGIYLEGWMTETFALWNLAYSAPDVQSRFGWALSDENMKNMKSINNDEMAVGDFPMSMKVKSFLAALQWEGSHFIGPGLCLWLTLFFCILFYIRNNKRYILAAIPLFANTATLLVSTPASAVFRYSFAYVLGLPILLIYFLYKEK